MRSGELARVTGVSTDTLRHYERLGLLARPGRTAGNYRWYSRPAEQRVELIQGALRIGFSLSELKTILGVRDGGGAPCRQVRQLLGLKIVQVNKQIHNLTLLRTELHRLAKDWDKRLSYTKAGQAARLLENVPRRFESFSPPSLGGKKGR